jgi:hypothetical protein
MIARLMLLLAIGAGPAALAQSSQGCPWLNAGTAARILGAEVAVTAHSDSNWSGACRFVTSAAMPASIEIRVGNTDTHPCGAGAAQLTAIGNQAVLCSLQAAGGRRVQTVSGRVRDAWFSVTLAMPSGAGERTPSPGEPARAPAIEFLAEQVAGNLY